MAGQPADIYRSVVEEIRTALLNKRPLVKCTWAAVQEAVSQEERKVLKASGSNEVDKYAEKFDAELQAKDQKIADAEKEIGRLQAEVRKYESQAAVGQGLNLIAGRERDLYAGEVSNIIREALEDAADRVPNESRREHILKDALQNIPKSDLPRSSRETLKELLRDYKSMDAKVRKGLEDLGFEIEEEGKHYKLIYQGDGRYTFSLSKTSSDHRAGLNMASDIAKQIF